MESNPCCTRFLWSLRQLADVVFLLGLDGGLTLSMLSILQHIHCRHLMPNPKFHDPMRYNELTWQLEWEAPAVPNCQTLCSTPV